MDENIIVRSVCAHKSGWWGATCYNTYFYIEGGHVYFLAGGSSEPPITTCFAVLNVKTGVFHKENLRQRCHRYSCIQFCTVWGIFNRDSSTQDVLYHIKRLLFDVRYNYVWYVSRRERISYESFFSSSILKSYHAAGVSRRLVQNGAKTLSTENINII